MFVDFLFALLLSIGRQPVIGFFDIPQNAVQSRQSELQAFGIGGGVSTVDKFPYLVSLRAPSDGSHLCTGSVISESLVLSAAHCVDPKFGGFEKPLVDFGRTCTSCEDEAGIRTVGVKTSIKHTKWNGTIQGGADLALLVLEERVDGPYLQVVMQDDPSEIFWDMRAFDFAGYGLVRSGRVSDVLQETELYYREHEFCHQLYSALGYPRKPEDTFCATGLGRAEVCRGDSGAPLILKGVSADQDLAVGILSAGGADCGSDVQPPALFTNLSFYQSELRFYVPLVAPAPPTTPEPTEPPKVQEQALMELKAQNQNASRLRGWDSRFGVCQWTGVGCDADGNVNRVFAVGPGRVVLEGTLPAAWSVLTHLEEINLRNNKIEGTLPSQWSTLTRLRKLIMPINVLSGTLPREWSTMTRMKTVSLISNRLTGTLPPEWSEWRQVQSIYLMSNNLTGVVPPQWLTTGSSIQQLLLRGNKIETPSLPLPGVVLIV